MPAQAASRPKISDALTFISAVIRKLDTDPT
jgi:hypothetical protein